MLGNEVETYDSICYEIETMSLSLMHYGDLLCTAPVTATKSHGAKCDNTSKHAYKTSSVTKFTMFDGLYATVIRLLSLKISKDSIAPVQSK